MRYYEYLIDSNTPHIKEHALIKINEYSYNNPIGAVNSYMYKMLKNSIYFIAYREDDKGIYAVLSFDEKKYTLTDAFDSTREILKDVFQIINYHSEPHEITIYQCLDRLNEARRRELLVEGIHRYIEATNLFVHEYMIDKEHYYFEFQESIVPDGSISAEDIYDDSVKKELENIASHNNFPVIEGNVVHYVISGRSLEAVLDITKALTKHLLDANRIHSRRIEMISEIHPHMYNNNIRLLEKIIENNTGGVIIIDLTEKFGHDPVEYKMTCKYLERVLKEYRNQCLFIFTYNMDSPGFAYTLLPELKKYVIPVMLREGSGDRKTAINYLKTQISKSEYSKYAKQANEFMKQYPGNSFSQTDVLAAYEKFEPWCLNKNILQAYDYNLSDDFMLDRSSNAISAEESLNKMIGLGLVKEKIKNIIAADIVEKERKARRGLSYKTGTMHMVFSGNPGTAKTTVAQLFARLSKEKGVLKSGAFVERAGLDLDGLGCITAIREAFDAAKGGVLFIDEAYSLCSSAAITVLIQELEAKREDVIVILAGYDDRMRDFMKRNEGLKSRIPYWIDFPDYNEDELTDIFKLMIKDRGFTITDEAVNEAYSIFEKMCRVDNFGNGRYARNLLENAIQAQSSRLIKKKNSVSNIGKKELFLITHDDIKTLDDATKNARKPGAARKELNEMIGLSSTKKIINKAVASLKLKKTCQERGISKDNSSYHMVFTGNPGTAKTTVARLFAEIMKDEKVLPTGTFVEVGRADLVGDHVGATALLVKEKFKEAQGGVLFIDEAYSLCDGYTNGYGDEAINTIVQEMENNRDRIIVIFAGYPKPMEKFLDRNPGMASRIAFKVAFDDYSMDELCMITKLMLKNRQMTITTSAMEKLRDNFNAVVGSTDFGNGRYVRKMLEEAEMNMAERIFSSYATDIPTKALTTIEEEDIPEASPTNENNKQPLGFHL